LLGSQEFWLEWEQQMIRIKNIKIPVQNDNEAFLQNKICQKMHIKKQDLLKFNIHKRVLDARKEAIFIYEIDALVNNYQIPFHNPDIIKTPNEEYLFPLKGKELMINRPIIIGSGPAGLFCAYLLSKLGYKPLIIERGEEMDQRTLTVQKFWDTGLLNTNSNVQFGEGGAGTFSDGKLNTLIKDPTNRHRFVFTTFINAGAPKEIIYDYNPHIGTDCLRDVIKNLHQEIIKMGGNFLFKSKLTSIICENDQIKAIEINNQAIIKTNILVLAIGHSARDTFRMLNNYLIMQSKPFAVGLRVEHNQEMINKAQYKDKAKYLPNASYKLTYKAADNRGVYSFCMCPGGYIVNASSENNKLAINGMSNYNRESSNANSAIVVTLLPSDFNSNDPFSGLKFQEELEKKAFDLGHGKIPISLYKDYKLNKATTKLGTIEPLFKGNYTLTNLRELLPNNLNNDIMEAMESFDQKIKGFAADDVILAGIESRTSSPIRILRNELLEANIKGIYPCGEGAGYAGGITSAAIDGLKVAEEIIKKYKPEE
jgi:uncharacterized FAD-dependent dehydrogenase